MTPATSDKKTINACGPIASPATVSEPLTHRVSFMDSNLNWPRAWVLYPIQCSVLNRTVQRTVKQSIFVFRGLAGAMFVLVCALTPFIATAVAQTQPQGERTTIVVGGDKYFPPYEFLDKNGEPTGFNVALTRAIAEVMGIEVEFVFGDWADMRRGLGDGQVDILQGMVSSEERTQQYEFAPPHAIVYWALFARKGTPKVQLADLVDKAVIVQRDDIAHDYLLENDLGAEIVPIATHAGALRLLASGKHDFALTANLPSLYLSREIGLSNIEPVTKTISMRYGYAVKKGNTELLAQFSEGLAILKNTGRYQDIYDEWLGPLEVEGIPWKELGLIGAGVSSALVLILGGIVIWNRALRRNVESRTRELQLHQQQLIQADKMTSLGILVSGVAHEINNPAGLLLLNLPVLSEAHEDIREILEDHYREHGDFPFGGLSYSRMRDEIPAMLEEMGDGAKRIKRIVDDLKDFARQRDPDLSEMVDLNDVVETSIRLVDASIRKATCRFEVEYTRALPQIRGDAQRIEQVVINLILNACQALEDTSKAISLKTRQQAGWVMLEVSDEGRGIDPDNLARLTDPFFTTKREDGGTGLGLSVSAGIVQEHGGSLDFDSNPGKGTRATLSLPIAADLKTGSST